MYTFGMVVCLSLPPSGLFLTQKLPAPSTLLYEAAWVGLYDLDLYSILLSDLLPRGAMYSTSEARLILRPRAPNPRH